jgi:hypothetical protein
MEGGFTALCFSLITLATAGYGDVVLVAGVVRMLAAMKAIVGRHFVGLLIVQLVSLLPSKGRHTVSCIVSTHRCDESLAHQRHR